MNDKCSEEDKKKVLEIFVAYFLEEKFTQKNT